MINQQKRLPFKKSNLKCLYTNATSLNNKFEELEIIAQSKDLDLIFVTETWFSDSYSPLLDGYEAYTFNRKNRIGGGVAIYVSKNLDSFEIFDELLCDVNIEQNWCGIKVANELILAGCIYRPPGVNESDPKIVECLKRSYNFMQKFKYSGVLICGDFNCPRIDWNSGGFPIVSSPTDSFDYLLVDSLQENFYFQNIISPTYQDACGIDKSLLDLVITESNDRIYNICHGPPLGAVSKGHHTLFWDYTLRTCENTDSNFKSSKYNYQKGDYQSLSEFISKLNWNQILANLSADQMYEKFIEYYNLACSKFIPRKGVTKRNKAWMTYELKS
jgi:hypothetical protein